MPRSRIIDLSYGDIAPADMTLQLDCWVDELSPAQLAAFEQAEQEHNDIRSKLNDVMAASGAENLYLGEIFSAYQVPGVAQGLDKIGKAPSIVRKEVRTRQLNEEKKIKAERERESTRKRDSTKVVEVIEDDDEEDEYTPISKRVARSRSAVQDPKRSKDTPIKLLTRGAKITALPSSSKTVSVRPSENSAVGGLAIGENKKKEIVDLTKDEPVGTKMVADSREVTFNKLQGKTFPSLVVVARPTLKVAANFHDRQALDSKVKNVLMHTAAKYTEWLIQQGLVRSDQMCQVHPSQPLKLGMYSDASKFPYSGGYVWISDCCPSRFVSVFNGSLFEGAGHPPSVLLKLIYHWSCQTNVQNVVQWVKVDNLYVKGLFTWLRAVCTVALHQHMSLLGGHGKKIEVGVISLGTTSQGGHQKQVKVEVLGVLDPAGKIVRLRAVEPLADGEKNYKKRFAKILEPLAQWVQKDSQILTDLTVDKSTLQSMGYKNVSQAQSTDGKYLNSNIMDYLRTVVPRMFQNTLSLLSRQIIQQFLDELVWRECYGTTPGKTFDNIVSHISEQTRPNARESLISRLAKVSNNPFKNWSQFSDKTPMKAIRSDFFETTAHMASIPSTTISANRNRNNRNKRKEPSPLPVPQPGRKALKLPVKEELPSKYKVKIPPQRRDEPKEPMIYIESFYYGIYETGTENDAALAVDFEANCPECHELFTKNTDLMDHLKTHANPVDEENENNECNQCRYCLANVPKSETIEKHLSTKHPIETKSSGSYNCITCWVRCSSVSQLSNHMQKSHKSAELPFNCGCCDYRSSSLRHTVDHFYSDHTASGTLQCPFCLKIYTIVANNEQITTNIDGYLEHLKQHMAKDSGARCTRCSLIFLHKGSNKLHQMYDHNSLKGVQSVLRECCKNTVSIPKPTWKKFNTKEPITYQQHYPNLTIYLPNGKVCLECDSDYQEDNHIRGSIACQKCTYQTACTRAILEHVGTCNGTTTESSPPPPPPAPLGKEMFCICGFSCSDGNDLARHLATCERKSAYETAELAQQNTVKCNMLDMLGLVRRDGEDDEESNEDLLIPADQQQQLLSKSVDRDEDEETTKDDGTTDNSTVADASGEESQNTDGGGSAGQTTNSTQPISSQADDFNTQLSLDDFTPGSVAPPIEHDRTPQLSDEYQSLATPRVGPYPAQYDQNEYENANAEPRSEYSSL